MEAKSREEKRHRVEERPHTGGEEVGLEAEEVREMESLKSL